MEFCLRVTCMLGRGRGRVPAHDLRSSSRARLSISNCLSCSRTEASREAVLAHCSIHTLGAEHRTGQDRTGVSTRINQYPDVIKEQRPGKPKDRGRESEQAQCRCREEEEVLIKLISGV